MTDVAAVVTSPAQPAALSPESAAALVAECVAAGAPVSFPRIPTGRVQLDPVDPGDHVFEASSVERGRRDAAGGRGLGPDAVSTLEALFGAAGWSVEIVDASWRPGSAGRWSAEVWLGDWVGGAVQDRPALAEWGEEYLRNRRSQLAVGRLRIVVEARDVVAWPP